MTVWRCTTEATLALWHVNPVNRFGELVFMPQPLYRGLFFLVPLNGTGFAPINLLQVTSGEDSHADRPPARAVL